MMGAKGIYHYLLGVSLSACQAESTMLYKTQCQFLAQKKEPTPGDVAWEKEYVAFQCRVAHKSPTFCRWGRGYYWGVTTHIDSLLCFAAVLSLGLAHKLHSGHESSIETGFLKEHFVSHHICSAPKLCFA